MGDNEEVVLNLQDKGTGTPGPRGLTVERRSEWLLETEPHQGARPKILQEGKPTMEADQVGDTRDV